MRRQLPRATEVQTGKRPFHEGRVAQARRRRTVGADRMVLLVQIATAVGVVLTLAGIVQLILNDLGDLVPLVIVTLLGGLVLRRTVLALAEPGDVHFLARITAAGILLRMGLALVVHYSLPVWFFAPDQFTYQDVGWRTLQYLRGLGTMPWQIQHTAEIGYFYWNAFLYWIFGFAPVAPKLVNAFLGTISAVVTYRLGGELAGRGTARASAVLAMFFPSLVLWSTQNLRDPVVLLLTLILFLAMVRLRVRPSGRSFFALALALSLLVLFRDYMAAMALLGLLGATFLTKARSLPANMVTAGVLFGLAVLAYQQLGLGVEWVESASFEALAQQRQYMAVGGSAFRAEADISTPLRSLQFLPLGMAFFLFSPFPWQIGSLLTVLTLPEQLVWYALIPMVIKGTGYLVRTRYHVVSPIMVFLGLSTSLYALVEGNAGTAYRHRAQVLVFFLIAAAAGIAVRAAKRKAAAGGRPA